jgi:hypothetical protein
MSAKGSPSLERSLNIHTEMRPGFGIWGGKPSAPWPRPYEKTGRRPAVSRARQHPRKPGADVCVQASHIFRLAPLRFVVLI